MAGDRATGAAVTSLSAILCIFPSLGGAPGGVQVSGRLAWRAVSEAAGGLGEFFCYGRAGAEEWTGARRAMVAHTRPGAVLAAIRRRSAVKSVLVWHLGVSKLLPFLTPRDARVAVFLHGVEAWKPLDWFTRGVLAERTVLLTNSDFTWRRFVSANPGFEGQCHRTVLLGIDSPAEAPIPAPAAPPAVLMVSRLVRSEAYKGHREMIAAWPLVLERIPEAELWIAGEGDLRQDLEQIVRDRGLGARVRFRCQVSEAEKQDLLARCRSLAMPSRGEGFGLVYPEAMRMGRPCLVSTADAGREVVNPPEAGLAADPANLRDLAEAVCRLLAPGPEWDRWSAEARRRYERHFTAKHFQERLLAALRDDSRS